MLTTIYKFLNKAFNLLEDSKVNKNDVVGIGVDFTSSTIIFLDEHLNRHRHEKI